MNENHVLIVDDDVNRCKMLDYRLQKAGYRVTYTTDPVEAVDIFKAQNIDVVISDIRMQSMGGIELLNELKNIDPMINVILITAFGKTSEMLLEALRGGAFEFLEKIEDIDLLTGVVEKAIKDREIKLNYSYYKEQYDEGEDNMLIGNNEQIDAIRQTVKNIAPADSTVLITGESGTGKEIVARMIHDMSGRRNKNFVSVNCAAINENLLESELFGHKKGSFTGAYTNKDGLFKIAHKGSIFLDEIAEMSTQMQVKLLRVIQEREISPIGSVETIPVDARIIAATNKDIESEVENSTFRKDLFYRINVIRIHMPPLRERRDDIKLLFDYYVKKYAAKYNKHIDHIERDVYNVLSSYGWPGNVREMMNIIERIIVIKQDNSISKKDIPLEIKTHKKHIELTGNTDRAMNLEYMEKAMIERALNICDGDKASAARMLGINPSTLYRKLKKYDNEDK